VRLQDVFPRPPQARTVGRSRDVDQKWPEGLCRRSEAFVRPEGRRSRREGRCGDL